MARKDSINIKDYSTWPLLMSVVFAVLIAAVIFYLSKTFLTDDVSAQISRKDAEIVKQENQYKKDAPIAAIVPKLKEEVKRLKVIQEGLKKFLPTKVSMPSLVDDVYLVGRNNGIVFDKLVPKRYIEEKYYSIKPIALKAKVGFESMASFIEEVTTLERIMNVNAVNFKVEGDQMLHKNANAPLKMTAELRTYVFKDTLPDDKK